MTHISIAEAKHRGEKRKMAEEISAHYRNTLRRTPRIKGRRPWLRAVLNMILSEPNQVTLDVQFDGESIKQVICRVLSIRLVDNRWQVVTTVVRPRSFDVNELFVPLVITSHLIERTMQRKSMERALMAVEYLAPTIGIAVQLFNMPVAELLLPCGDGEGAVQMIWSRKSTPEAPERALVTYIAPHQLRYAQKLELEELYHTARRLRDEAIARARRR